MLSVAPPSTQRGQRSGAIVRDRAVSLVKAAVDDPAHVPVAGYTYRIADARGAVAMSSITTSTTPVSLGRLTMGATYTATEIDRPANAALYIPVRSSFTFTVPDGGDTWTVLAQDPRMPVPRVSTQVNMERVMVGAALSDVVTVDGDDGEDGTIEATRYGPVSAPPTGRCSDLTPAQYAAAPALRIAVPIAGSVSRGNGTVTVAGPVVTRAGCYGWAEVLTLRPSGATVSSPPTAPHESTLVTTPPASPPTQAPPTQAPPAQTPPTHPHTPAAHLPPRAVPPTTPPLARTGTPFPVGRTVGIGSTLLALGVGFVWLGRRRTTSARSTSC